MSDPESIDWKEKFRQLARKMETEAEAHAQTEQLLCRVVTRLTAAASGLDPQLDPHLQALGEAVRNGADASLRQNLDAFSDALLRIQDERPPHRLPAPAVVVAAAPAPSAGVLARLLRGVPGAAARTGTDPNRQLLQLLERLDWPAQLRGDIDAFKDMLGPGAAAADWLRVIEGLAQSVGRALGDAQSEIRKTENFLGDLTGRLQEIAERVLGSRDAREAAIQDGADLGQAISDEVGGIRHAVRKASDLSQLKAEVAMRLDAIQSRVTTHLQTEERRHREHEQTEQQLRTRLQALEDEAATLRREMAEAYYKALKDPVTGLPNRAAYDERMHQEYSRWKRFGSMLALLLWDIDDFKLINDRFGHSAGDKALGVIGRILAERVRETDFVARYGGEEFALLMTGAALDDVLRVADQIREVVAGSGFHSGDRPVALTISCGISAFREGDTPERVFERADEALYQAKRAGKNRCLVAP